MSGYSFGKDISGLLKFLALAVLAILVIAALNWLPRTVDKAGMHPYKDIREMKAEPAMQSLLVPSYFPESVSWPPKLLIAQTRPFMAALMEFDGTDSNTVLVISQSASEDFDPDGSLRMLEVRQSVKVDFAQGQALLETGLCEDAASCSSLSWSQGDVYVRVLMRAPSVVLLQIAESML